MTMSSGSSGRVRREIETVRRMIEMYCSAHHTTSEGLCNDCRTLAEYAERRVRACRFAADKPTCQRCPVHCFRPDAREEIRRVMRYAGPRMLWRHPLLAIRHLLDGRKRAPASAGEEAR